jgi:ketosteroid isomerase-like protein
MKTASVVVVIAAIAILSAVLLGASKVSVAAARSSASFDSSAKQGSMEQQIVSKEREGLDALKTGDLTRFADLTADDAVFVDARGPAGKAQILKNVVGFKITEYSMDNVEFKAISANAGLITYKIAEKGVSHGKEFAAQVYVSSIWAKQKGRWVCLFSQETGAM